MTYLKLEWLEKMAHVHAQSAAWFFIYLMSVVVLTLWLSARAEK